MFRKIAAEVDDLNNIISHRLTGLALREMPFDLCFHAELELAVDILRHYFLALKATHLIQFTP